MPDCNSLYILFLIFLIVSFVGSVKGKVGLMTASKGKVHLENLGNLMD